MPANRLTGCCCLAFLLGQAALPAATLTLTPSADTSIISSGANPRGDQTILSGTRNTGVLDRGLLQFDLSSVPPGAVIQAVSLQLTVVMVPRAPADSRFDLLRLLTPWDESATWLNPTASATWAGGGAVAGRDYATNASASLLIQDVGVYQFDPTPDLAADVVRWLADPSSNHGWLLMSESEGLPMSARHFGSRESPDPAQLAIEYTLPVQAPLLSDVKLQQGILSFSFAAAAHQPYRVEALTNFATGAWTTLTNFPPLPAADTVTATNAATGPARYFRLVAE